MAGDESGPRWDGHLLLLHPTEEERLRGLAAWVRRGLEHGEKVIYTAAGPAPERTLVATLEACGVDAARAVMLSTAAVPDGLLVEGEIDLANAQLVQAAVAAAAREHGVLWLDLAGDSHLAVAAARAIAVGTSSAATEPAELAAPDVLIPAVEDVYDLATARPAIRSALASAQVDRLTVGNFAAVAGELLANAVQHGRPPAELRLWIRPDRLVCTVHDHGPGFDDPIAGYLPPADAGEHGGAGLWLVRQACDRLDMRSDSDGFSVRATTFLGRHHGAGMAGARARAEHARHRARAARERARELTVRLRQQQDALDLSEQRWQAVADQIAEIQRRSTAPTGKP